jgi:hypothetical protein
MSRSMTCVSLSSVPTVGIHTTIHLGCTQVRVKVKLPLCFNWAPHNEDVLGEWSYSATHSLTPALDGGEWSASRPGHFTPRERPPGTHWIGGWVGPRAVLDALVKRKIPRFIKDKVEGGIGELFRIKTTCKFIENPFTVWNVKFPRS